MSTPVIHRVGRFNVRVVPAPHPLYHGGRRDFSRARTDYEQRETILEVYDAAYDHSPAGQFISSYYVSTIVETPLTRLNLQGDVPAWTMDEEETAALVAIARAA